MKNNLSTIYKTAAAALVLVTGLSSCKDLTDINTDPNKAAIVPTTTILLSAEKQLVDNLRGETFSLKGAMLFSQYYSQNIYTDQSRYSISAGDLNTFWSNSYKTLNNLEEIIQLNTSEQTKNVAAAGTAGTNANQIAISRILKSYIFQTLTDAFGSVPYQSYGNSDPDFEALQQIQENYTPAYASQEKIYTDILNELKAAGDTLLKTPSATTFGASDIIYKGSNAKWAKFANSLRLRVATRIKTKLPQLSEQHFTDAVQKGVFSGNEDNAVFKYLPAAPNEAPLYRATVTANRKDYAVSHVLINVLKGETGPFNFADPRLSIYALPNARNEYIGQPYGLPLSVAGVNGPTDISLPGTAVNAADYGEVLMEYAEVAFLRSEHDNWNDASYRSGVQRSLEKWGVSADKVSEYLSKLPAANKENVLTQKYLALYMQGQEAWSEIRRTGYPLFLVKPGDLVWRRTTDTGVQEYRFEPLFGNGIPKRLYYPLREQSVNRENYQQALAGQGQDNLETALWWNK
ncbi:SusD/RagB family nutrient-binding outer membrane lipoprotein [Pararcticibacter amylolyticus]|uniref:SusD/RagB family nutrient-binding outer membrane lipoprotein n=1 Tax=Pararcticibacter amylolyticus TaxID=2173175 RepID=A0A2U2PKR5_9SPHI|nr:SusD/RagB family nutrient-binding outer membrane lipoprotein [Pararcticibacter amylolyticus]PWG81995.1 SusD/RagB family nutrient-binding outer membrane lipoprotein [Pararcticibacter amylolyticus]